MLFQTDSKTKNVSNKERRNFHASGKLQNGTSRSGETGDKVQITEYQSYMNYSYIIEPAVAMSGCYPNSQRIKAKEGTIVSVEKAPLSGYVVIEEFEE